MQYCCVPHGLTPFHLVETVPIAPASPATTLTTVPMDTSGLLNDSTTSPSVSSPLYVTTIPL